MAEELVTRADVSRSISQSDTKLVGIVLTYNSESSIAKVIEGLLPITDRIVVVDSGSVDSTVNVASKLGCEVVEHPFENYSAQRRWAQGYANLDPMDWVIHLDSDEVLSDELANSIRKAVHQGDGRSDGFLVKRLSYFWGHPIRHGHMNPSWHLRIFRAGKGRCEDRLYDQHFIVDGQAERIDGILHDLQLTNLEVWTASHNRWSSAEAEEFWLARQRSEDESDVLSENLFGDSRMRKRWIKNRIWYRMPLLVKPFFFFFYSYVIKLGFLDGKAGFVYHVLQAFWFRFLVDAKILEKKLGKEAR